MVQTAPQSPLIGNKQLQEVQLLLRQRPHQSHQEQNQPLPRDLPIRAINRRPHQIGPMPVLPEPVPQTHMLHVRVLKEEEMENMMYLYKSG